MNRRQFEDLAKLARERTRDAAMTVTQLMNARESAAVLVLTAADFLRGATLYVRDTKNCTPEEALSTAVKLFVECFGYDAIVAGLRYKLPPRKRKERSK